MSTLTRSLTSVDHAAHEVVHQVASAGHRVAETALHDADAVVDLLLSPLTVSLVDMHVETTEDDLR